MKNIITISVILMLVLTFPAYYVHLNEEYDREVMYRMELEDEANVLRAEVDSLKNECLIKDINIGRYESVIFQLRPTERDHFNFLLERSE
jgi:hypothetical protein